MNCRRSDDTSSAIQKNNYMNRFYTLMSIPALLAASALSSAAATAPIFSFDFEDETSVTDNFTVNNANGDATTWKWNKYTTGSTPYYYAQCYAYAASSYNDAMTTKTAYHLEKGHAYILNFQSWADSTPEGATLAVGYFSEGNEGNPIRVASTKPKYINKYQAENPPVTEAVFEVEESGDYYFTFIVIANSSCGGAAIDNLSLVDGGSPMTPQPVSTFTAEAADDFTLAANLSITLPSKSVTGKELPADGISKVEISRGGTLVQTLNSGLTPGTTINWSDSNATAGNNTYKVVVYNGELVSSAVETTVFVGPVTPNSPTSVTASKLDGGKIKVTWSAPTSSLEEQPLKSELITYNVYRKIDEGDPVVVASGISETEYEDSYTSDDAATLTYSVEAIYSGRKSAEVSSNSVKVGSYVLPFEESFADAILPDDWQITTSDTATYDPKRWKVASKMTASPSAISFDADGGMLTYNSANTSRNYWSQAISPEIKLNGAASPVLEFQFYHSYNFSSCNDRVVIEVSKDGGAFEEIDAEPVKRYAASQGWKLYQFPLSAYSDAGSIRISFKAISDYGADMAIDAIRVFAATAHDLEAGGLVADTEVDAGQEAEFTFTVKNVAFGDVKGEDYTVKTYLGGELLSTLEGQDVAATKSVDFTFKVPSHAGHVEGGLPVYAEIVYAEDENQENNVSDELTVNVNCYGGQGISDLTGKVEGNTLRLTWNGVEIENYEKLESELNLDGEEDVISKEAFDADNSIAWPSKFTATDGSEWVNIDKDGIDVPKQYNMPAGKRGFMYSSWDMTGNSNHKDYSGVREHGMLVAAAPSHGKGTASDYLVSPMLPGKGTHVLEFMAKSYSGACYADFYVEYTTASEYTAENIDDLFEPVAGKVHIDANFREGGKWEQYSYLLPADAKFVAIHFVGEAGVTYEEDDYGYGYTEVDIPSVLCLDNIKLLSEPMDKPTYNVYYREITGGEEEVATYAAASTNVKAPQKHNEAPVEENEYVLAAPAVATDYHVSAVYPQGETSLSAPYRLDIESGVESVLANDKVTLKADGRTLRAYSAGEEISITVYSSDGIILAKDVKGFTAAAAGAYVIKAGEKAVTIMVR